MGGSKVYFTDFRTNVGTSLTVKMQNLMRMAGIGDIDMDGKFVAIKMHFGELGNLSYLRPNYAKAVADLVKEQGGIPFLTDCNTLYPGSRKNALEHMDCANINGFNTITTGCQIIIGDGLRGTDDVTVPIPNGEYCQEAYIGRAVMDADIFLSIILKAMNPPDLAAPSKISEWVAEAEQVKCSSITVDIPRFMRSFVADADAVPRSAARTLYITRTKLPISIRNSAKVADAA